MQTIKRQVGKALGGSASLQPQRDLIYGICKILGIKRATKKKKKRSKKKDHGIIAADLPKVLVEQLFAQLERAQAVSDYCTVKAISTPPTISEAAPIV